MKVHRFCAVALFAALCAAALPAAGDNLADSPECAAARQRLNDVMMLWGVYNASNDSRPDLLSGSDEPDPDDTENYVLTNAARALKAKADRLCGFNTLPFPKTPPANTATAPPSTPSQPPTTLTPGSASDPNTSGSGPGPDTSGYGSDPNTSRSGPGPDTPANTLPPSMPVVPANTPPPNVPSAPTVTALPPAPVGPSIPGNSLTCNYTDASGQQQTSFTTKDPQFLKQGCPPIPGLISANAPPANASSPGSSGGSSPGNGNPPPTDIASALAGLITALKPAGGNPPPAPPPIAMNTPPQQPPPGGGKPAPGGTAACKISDQAAKNALCPNGQGVPWRCGDGIGASEAGCAFNDAARPIIQKNCDSDFGSGNGGKAAVFEFPAKDYCDTGPTPPPKQFADLSLKPDPTAVQACESKPPFLPWGGTGSASITVSGGKPCGIGWHDTGATILDSMTVTSQPSHGALKPHDQHVIIFTPAPGYKGQDSFMLSMQEHNGGRRATLKVKVSVTIQ